MRSIRHAFEGAVAALLLGCLACSGGGGYAVAHDSPPAYAYKYRHPHDKVMLVYSPDLAVYRVSGYRNYYFNNGRYYRLRDGRWYYTSHIKGPWVATSYQAIPSGLHKKYKATPPGHAKEKKNKSKYKRGHGKHGA